MTMAKRTPEDVAHMTRQVILRVLNQLRDDAGVEGGAVVPAILGDEKRFGEDLNADSLERVELIMAYEEEFGLVISDEDAEGLNTVGEAISYLQKRVAERAVRR
jgi:acyl carrier protein